MKTPDLNNEAEYGLRIPETSLTTPFKIERTQTLREFNKSCLSPNTSHMDSVIEEQNDG